jgi:hypothetical protein
MQCGMCEVGTKVLNIIRTSFVLHRHNGHGIRVSTIIFKRIISLSFCSGLNTETGFVYGRHRISRSTQREAFRGFSNYFHENATTLPYNGPDPLSFTSSQIYHTQNTSIVCLV